MKRSVWLNEMTNNIRSIVELTESLYNLPAEQLNARVDEGQWTILQCYDHLNLYNRYYVQCLCDVIDRIGSSDSDELKYSWIGKKSIGMMHPAKVKKQKTFKHMKPEKKSLASSVIDRFMDEQMILQSLLKKITDGNLNLNTRAIPVEFFRLLKMNVGEAIEFVVVHELRHVGQAMTVRENLFRNQTLVV